MVWQSTIFSLFLTLFIFLLILVGTFSFTHDIDYLVIKPIQRMVKLVQDIQTNPLGVEYKMLGEDDGFVKGLETTLLLTTINKIGGLLKVVFGEAGAAIIAKNLRDSNLYPSERSRLNLLGPGTRIFSVFGFCDIRQFTDTTECLQEEVMLFVNRIAYILHSIVVQCSGAANKNIGDAFLLTWKIDESLSSEQVSEVADKSLLAFCRTLIELSRHREFICEFSPKATQLLKQRFPSYTVRLGCGLHFGWAIEGAIGTDRKIDASYLSPHVSFVEYLEASTKVYGVAMVLSEPFVKLLTPEAFDCCRQIDRVCRSEDEDPVKLYTYDADLTINWDDIAIKYRKLSRRHALSSKLQRKNSRASSQIYGYGAQAPSAENHYMLKPQYSKNESAIKTNHSISSLPENVIHSINRLDSVEAKAIALRTHRSINEKGIRNIFNDIESGVSKRKVTENLTPYPPKIVVEKYSPIIWTKDDELRELRHVYSNAFRTAWTKGFDNYISGNWIEASILFEETFKLSGNSDGPSKYLLSIIASHGSSPPYNWEGWEPYAGETVRDTWKRRFQYGSFYFWLDLIATLSLLIEMPWVIGSVFLQNPSSIGVSSRISTMAGKVIRLLRIVRLVRVVRVMQLLKPVKRFSVKRKSSISKAATNGMNGNRTVEFKDQQDEDPQTEQSHVGAAMTELTNRRVIILILVMFVIIPLLTITDNDLSLQLASELVFHIGALNQSNPSLYENAFDLTLENTISNTPVIGILLNDNWYYKRQDLFDKLRNEEKAVFEYSNSGYYSKLEYNQRHLSVKTAQYSICTTIFIIFLLLAGSYFFSRDVNNLVIIPIERMVSLVKKISENPLGVEYKILGEKDGFAEGMETTILLATITKIGGLMRVGFGEAGAAIIAKNLSDSASGRLNLMGAGNKINSIFGFCDVRQFTDTTECLQEEVMLFVNRIAHILHSIVVQCSGAANKNIGDAFLLTWKIEETLSADQLSELADQALLAFCKSLIELSRQHEFICNFSTTATARLLQRFPGYTVRIGCGLHIGWAIEGAIGSNRKIDASYLSPNVSFTEFLESSTKQYGVSILLSEPFFQALSNDVQSLCRLIDRVKRSEEENPVGLYTYDTDLSVNWDELALKKRFANPPHPNRVQSTAMHKRASRRTSATRYSLTNHNGLSLAQINAAALSHHNSTSTHHNSALAHHNSALAHYNSAIGHQPVSSLGHISHNFESNRTFELRQLRNLSLEKGLRNISINDIESGIGGTGVHTSKEAPVIIIPKYNVRVWHEDIFLVELRNQVSDSFRRNWARGIEAYIDGYWHDAKTIFEEIYKLSHNKDGPAKYLLQVIADHGNQAPSDWQGYSTETDGH
eukprot:gene20916-27110_t